MRKFANSMVAKYAAAIVVSALIISIVIYFARRADKVAEQVATTPGIKFSEALRELPKELRKR